MHGKACILYSVSVVRLLYAGVVLAGSSHHHHVTNTEQPSFSGMLIASSTKAEYNYLHDNTDLAWF